MSAPEKLDRKALTDAFVRARDLLASNASVAPLEARALETTLRPLASAWEIQQVVVPLLDRAELWGLAMAWDSGADAKGGGWLLQRVERWFKLHGPEFAFLTLAELTRQQTAHDNQLNRAQAQLASERVERTPRYEANLAALAEVDPELMRTVERAHRTSIALRPVGTGLAEFAGLGQPCIQLWAVTPTEALAEAEALARQSQQYEDSFVAGVGDCSLPAAAVSLLLGQSRRVHLVELHASRLRALLELVDVAQVVRERRLLVHLGTRAIETLAPYASLALANPDSVAGGDNLALSLIRAAVGREPTDPGS